MANNRELVRSVDANDVEKRVVTCYGRRIGAVTSVHGRDHIVVRVDREAADLASQAFSWISSEDLLVSLRAEDVEMVTADAVWLRAL